MKYVLTILFLLQLWNLTQAQSKPIEISVDNFYRINFNPNQDLPTSDSESSIDFWGKAFSEKQLLDKFTVCLEVSYCDFELKSNPKIAEQRSEYIISRFENDYHINPEEINVSFVVDDYCIEGENNFPSTTYIVLYKK